MSGAGVMMPHNSEDEPIWAPADPEFDRVLGDNDYDIGKLLGQGNFK